MFRWIQKKWFLVYSMYWMLKIQKRQQRGEARVWKDAPLGVVGVFASFNEDRIADDDTGAPAAWRTFVVSARLERDRRLEQIMQEIKAKLGE